MEQAETDVHSRHLVWESAALAVCYTFRLFSLATTNTEPGRGFATREQLPLPTKPPFTAHLGNLSFDATEGDVQDFFHDCGVSNVRIVEDKLEHKPKGFGYVEFTTLDGLKKALDKDGDQFQGRNIRLSVADPRMSCHIDT